MILLLVGTFLLVLELTFFASANGDTSSSMTQARGVMAFIAALSVTLIVWGILQIVGVHV